MLILYLDESGDHSLSSVDPYYPVFTLSGCVFDQDYHDGSGTDSLSAYKKGLFGNDSIILHSADIGRRRNGFELLKDEGFRNRFYQETNALVGGLDFTAIAAVIKKTDHITRYGRFASNPYLYSLECMLERFYFMLHGQNRYGRVVAESRGPAENRELLAAYNQYMTAGTSYVSAQDLQSRISPDLTFRSKSDNVLGLQIADLAAIPASHMALGKPDRPDIAIVRSKMRRSWNGTIAGYGLIVLPK